MNELVNAYQIEVVVLFLLLVKSNESYFGWKTPTWIRSKQFES